MVERREDRVRCVPHVRIMLSYELCNIIVGSTYGSGGLDIFSTVSLSLRAQHSCGVLSQYQPMLHRCSRALSAINQSINQSLKADTVLP